jgi:capsular polysaccharide biosynthesis protein/Mrp family chromosome partitioning ATPase
MASDSSIDFRIVAAIIRRRWLLITCCFALLMTLAIVAIQFIEDEFTAEARVLLDKKISGALTEPTQVAQVGLDKAAVESEIQILHSQAVMNTVIETLKTADELKVEGYNFLSVTNPFEQYQLLAKGLAVTRVGDSYVLRVSYTAHTPEQAAQIANAFARGYITEQRRILALKSDQTLSWFQTKLDELKAMTQKADKAVADFRLRYNTLGGAGTSLNQLNVLVKESETYHQILNDYLDRYETMNQESSFPFSESRVISEALPPPKPSHPKVPLLLGAAAVVSLGLGIILALFIDLNEKSIRRAGQLREQLALPFIGFVPLLRFWQKIKIQPVSYMDAKVAASEPQIFALQNPQSGYTAAVRGLAAHLASPDTKNAVIIGITNLDAAPASRTLIYNLAEYKAMNNHKCLYIDMDFSYGANQTAGWVNIIVGDTQMDEVLLKSTNSELHILPAGYVRDTQSVSRISTQSIGGFLRSVSADYDYIFINLPDLKKSADLHLITPLLDACYINLKWGKSKLSAAQFYLQKSGIPDNKIIGTLVSDTHPGKLKRHYGYDA